MHIHLYLHTHVCICICIYIYTRKHVCVCVCAGVMYGAVDTLAAQVQQQNLQVSIRHWNTLNRVATHGDTWRHTATHCNTLQHTVTHCNALVAPFVEQMQHQVYVCGEWVLQCIAVVQWVAVCCSVLASLSSERSINCVRVVRIRDCSTAQHTATYCNTLQPIDT